MKVLYAVSLFSGLRTSVKTGTWQPTGAPTIYRMIEALDRSEWEVEFVFCCKDREAGAGLRRPSRIFLQGLKNQVWLLPYLPWRAPLHGLTRLSSEMRQALFLMNRYRKERFDLCYFNNGNLLLAAFFAYAGFGRVLLRVMGAYPVMKEVAEGSSGLGSRIESFAYRAPYDHVICSQDGSGGEWFMEKALRKTTPRTVLLNGVDRSEEAKLDPLLAKKIVGASLNGPLILFVGKLEPAKGCDEFVEAIVGLAQEGVGPFSAALIGNGTRFAPLQEKVREKGLTGTVAFHPRIPHSQMLTWYRAADVYVSLNKLGSLSNANLEAMRCGKCMVILESDKVHHVDQVTDTLLDRGSVVRIPRLAMAENLVQALRVLLADPAGRARMEKRVRAIAERLVPTWDERVQEEMRLLQHIAWNSAGPMSAGPAGLSK